MDSIMPGTGGLSAGGRACTPPSLTCDLETVYVKRGSEGSFLRVLRPSQPGAGEEPERKPGDSSFKVSAAVRKVEAALGMSMEQFMDIFRYSFDRFDMDGDGNISLEEFQLACATLGLKVGMEDVQILFEYLSDGKEYWASDELRQDSGETLQQAVQDAVTARYKSLGLQPLGLVLDSITDTMMTGSLVERLGSLTSILQVHSDKLLELLETGISIIGTGCAAFQLGSSIFDGEGVDAISIVPLVMLLWKTSSDAQKVMSDTFTTDLCQEHARVFTTTFKPAGLSLPCFQRLCGEADARWISVPKGSELPAVCSSKKLQIIGNGRLKIKQKSAVPGLRETSASLGPGTFVDLKAFLGSDGIGSHLASNRHLIVAAEDTLILELDMPKLRRYIKVEESASQAFHFALARSQVNTMLQLKEQSLRTANELPLLFRDLALSAASEFEADRATFWIHNAEESLLWTLFVAEDGSCTYVAIDHSSGLAGQCLSLGDVINVPDCYQNPLFNQEVDRTTGYKTSSMLCVPIIDDGSLSSKESQVIGVLQLINKVKKNSLVEPVADPLLQPHVSVFTPEDEKLAEQSMRLTALIVKQMVNRYNGVCKRM